MKKLKGRLRGWFPGRKLLSIKRHELTGHTSEVYMLWKACYNRVKDAPILAASRRKDVERLKSSLEDFLLSEAAELVDPLLPDDGNPTYVTDEEEEEGEGEGEGENGEGEGAEEADAQELNADADGMLEGQETESPSPSPSFPLPAGAHAAAKPKEARAAAQETSTTQQGAGAANTIVIEDDEIPKAAVPLKGKDRQGRGLGGKQPRGPDEGERRQHAVRRERKHKEEQSTSSSDGEEEYVVNTPEKFRGLRIQNNLEAPAKDWAAKKHSKPQNLFATIAGAIKGRTESRSRARSPPRKRRAPGAGEPGEEGREGEEEEAPEVKEEDTEEREKEAEEDK